MNITLEKLNRLNDIKNHELYPTCKLCHEKTSNIKFHLRNVHGKYDNLEQFYDSNYICKICDNSDDFEDKRKFLDHLATHISMVKCDCGKTITIERNNGIYYFPDNCWNCNVFKFNHIR